jgi:hypothetical protein
MTDLTTAQRAARLSRYPTRTLPTDPGHANTRIHPAAGRSGPFTTAQRQD